MAEAQRYDFDIFSEELLEFKKYVVRRLVCPPLGPPLNPIKKTSVSELHFHINNLVFHDMHF